MPKISIITPVYVDTEDKINWLDEMIQSVLRQTVTDWELILIDDKSPILFDGLKQRYNLDNRLRWLENAANYGPAMTRNTAVNLAESDCILPLDSDDMLGTNETLEAMYDAWSIDKTKTIYGNIHIYKPVGGGEFQRLTNTKPLAQYSIEGAMHLEWGIMPVTTMHSREAHIKAGGWKSELNHGREDLEYWIACGKAGYCGQKINHTTLLYRKHEQSRDYRLKFENQQLRAMQEKIKAMHSDMYRGRFPMGCCGKSSSGGGGASPNTDPLILSQQAQTARKITVLEGYDEKDLEWVAYYGDRRGRFDILARGATGTPSKYTILGTGHVFQIHKSHRKLFSDRQRLRFAVNQPDPRVNQTEPEPEPQPEPQVIPVPKPELSTLVRVDKASAVIEIVNPAIEITEDDSRIIEQDFIDEIIIEPNPPESVSNVIVQMPTDYMKSRIEAEIHIDSLGLSPDLSEVLDNAGYTIEKLAESTPEQLTELKGIGVKRGETIINRAKELINET